MREDILIKQLVSGSLSEDVSPLSEDPEMPRADYLSPDRHSCRMHETPVAPIS